MFLKMLNWLIYRNISYLPMHNGTLPENMQKICFRKLREMGNPPPFLSCTDELLYVTYRELLRRSTVKSINHTGVTHRSDRGRQKYKMEAWNCDQSSVLERNSKGKQFSRHEQISPSHCHNGDCGHLR